MKFSKPRKKDHTQFAPTASPEHPIFSKSKSNTFCIGGRHYSNTKRLQIIKKMMPKKEKLKNNKKM